MSDLPTLEEALKLADQDSPLPSLAGPALKRLRLECEAEHEERTRLEHSRQVIIRQIHQMCLNAGVNPAGRDYIGVLSNRITRLVAGEKDPVNDSATLTTLIAELRAREAVGRTKYGTNVDRADLTNGRWRQHLREELMDALLYSLAEERTAIPTMKELAVQGRIRPIRLEEEPNSPNSGHGHVRPRPDGVKARCGGPGMCKACWNEERNIEMTRAVEALAKMPTNKGDIS